MAEFILEKDCPSEIYNSIAVITVEPSKIYNSIAVITVEPAVQWFSRESEAYQVF